MCDGDPGGECRKRRSKRARRVALNDEQIGRRPQLPQERCGDTANVPVRIFLPGAIKPPEHKIGKPEFVWIEAWMLTGQDHAWRKVAGGERASHGRQLDCFGPGAQG